MIAYIDTETNSVCACTLMSSVPNGITGYEVIPPQDKLFRNAWTLGYGELLYNLDMAKDEVHTMRRAKRDTSFAPLDIKATIPNEAVQAEADRQVIRDADAGMQTNIDLCSNVDELRTLIDSNGL